MQLLVIPGSGFGDKIHFKGYAYPVYEGTKHDNHRSSIIDREYQKRRERQVRNLAGTAVEELFHFLVIFYVILFFFFIFFTSVK